MAGPLDWTKEENDLIVADYFAMFNDELAGRAINKSKTRRILQPLLKNRTEGAIEFKRQNISAWLAELGLPYIKGYVPMARKQGPLLQVILDYIYPHKRELEAKFKKFSEEVVDNKEVLPDFSLFVEEPPEMKKVSEPKVPYARRPFKVNYLEREQKNSSLGESGEQLVLAFEKWKLVQAGMHNLAEQIKWISQGDDGAGFDILSKNTNGTDKYIEVKTTKMPKESPFFFSKTEFIFSKEKAADYYLYRVFDFAESPKMFQAQGSFDTFCKIEPVQYRGSF